jgi:outer membrane protein assembly factor BamB
MQSDMLGGTSSPAIGTDGTIYIGSASQFGGFLYAISAEGSEKWKYEVGEGVYSSPAIGKDGTIYFGSNDDHLYALNPDGTEKWKFKAADDVQTSPTIDSMGIIYFGSGGAVNVRSNFLYALNSDGTERWKFQTGGAIYSSPALGTDAIYFSCSDSYLYAVDAGGALLWKYQIANVGQSTPSVGYEGTIYIGSGTTSAGYIHAVAPNGTEKWSFKAGGKFANSPAVNTDNTVYAGSNDHILYAINSDGTEDWKFEADSYISSSPVICKGGNIYFGTNGFNLIGVDMLGKVVMNFKASAPIYSSPAIGSDGTIYIGSGDSVLYAIGSPTPTVPRNLMTYEEMESIELEWDKPLDDGGLPITRYNLYRTEGFGERKLLESMSNMELSYIDSNIEAGKIYFYEVTAVNGVGESEASRKAVAIKGGVKPYIYIRDPRDDVFLKSDKTSAYDSNIDMTDIKIWKGIDYVLIDLTVVGTIQGYSSGSNYYVYSVEFFTDKDDDTSKGNDIDFTATFVRNSVDFENSQTSNIKNLEIYGSGTDKLRIPVPLDFLPDNTDFQVAAKATYYMGVDYEYTFNLNDYDEAYMDWSLDSINQEGTTPEESESEDTSKSFLEQNLDIVIIIVIILAVVICIFLIYAKTMSKKERGVLLSTPQSAYQTWEESSALTGTQPSLGPTANVPAKSQPVGEHEVSVSCPSCGENTIYQETMQQSYCPKCKKFA